MNVRLFILLPLLLHVPDSYAQNAFTSSTAGIELSANIAETRLNDYWLQKPGVTLFWAMPFYLGELEFRAGYLPFRSFNQDIPDINNILTTMNWILPVNITNRLSVTGGLFIGNNFMYRPAKGPLNRPESEFLAGLTGQIRYRVSGTFSMRGGIYQTRVYTFHRLNLTYIGFGGQYHFKNPDWLINFFR